MFVSLYIEGKRKQNYGKAIYKYIHIVYIYTYIDYNNERAETRSIYVQILSITLSQFRRL